MQHEYSSELHLTLRLRLPIGFSLFLFLLMKHSCTNGSDAGSTNSGSANRLLHVDALSRGCARAHTRRRRLEGALPACAAAGSLLLFLLLLRLRLALAPSKLLCPAGCGRRLGWRGSGLGRARLHCLERIAQFLGCSERHGRIGCANGRDTVILSRLAWCVRGSDRLRLLDEISKE
jgi:hypothetical protein